MRRRLHPVEVAGRGEICDGCKSALTILVEMSHRHLFLDMDGVLCDFDLGCRRLFQDIGDGETVEEYKLRVGKTPFWRKIRENPDFWFDLEPIPGALDAFARLEDQFSTVTILSSPDKNDPNCISGKEKWLDTWLGKDVARVFERNKFRYAGPDSVLIDDLPKNIDPWRAAGGVGILFEGDWEKVFDRD